MASNNRMDIQPDNSDWPPKFIICVGTIVLKESKVLFIRQAKGESLEGQWSIPWGFVNNDETPEEAAIRETIEESGIKTDVDGLLGLQNLSKSGWLGIIFLSHHIEGEPNADGKETDMAAYLSLDDLINMDEPIEPWCKWLAIRVLEGNYSLIHAEQESPYRPRLGFF